MTTPLLILIAVLLLAVVALQLALLFRRATVDLSPIQQATERTERAVREEFSRNRTEAGTVAQQSRLEIATALKNIAESLDQRLKTMQEENAASLEKMRQTVDEKLQGTLEKQRSA